MADKIPYQSSLPELVRTLESQYNSGTTTISQYVQFNMLHTLNKIDAYINSKHITGETDSLGREKPFFNIVIAARNIWYRATDIDRKDIKVKANKTKDTIDAFLATVFLQQWMKKERFGSFLNEWGRTLATYGSAVSKFIENSDGLHCVVVPWNRLIVDQIDFNNNVKIEVLEYTQAQLKKKKYYNQEMIDNLVDAVRSRETIDKKRKDNKNYYIKVYEVHGDLPVSYLSGNPDDTDYEQQMHVVSFLAKKDNPNEFDEFTLFSGREKKDPYMKDDLISEDGRTLAIGAVEHLFDAQWMQNHSVKAMKDQLDIASKLIFQTSDSSFVGQNALEAIENGDILIHAENAPLTQLANTSHDVESLQSFGEMWKSLGNEINGISEAMTGKNPPSGSAWRQTQALLQESHSLFDLMKQNKGLAIENMLREFVLPYIKSHELNNSDEISATLEDYDIQRIDAMYIKNKSIQHVNGHIIDLATKRAVVSPEEQQNMLAKTQSHIQDSLSSLGGQRFFKPDEISDKTWQEQFKDLEWELDIDITGESEDVNDVLTTLNTALQVVMNPSYSQNKQAQFIVGQILRETAVISPLQLADMPGATPPPPAPQNPLQPSTTVASSPAGLST